MRRLMLNKLRIAIVGSSSQVGSSVAFYLRHFTQHEPVCFIRSSYSSLFFDMLNINAVEVDISNTEELKKALQQIDIVADFSLPGGENFEIEKLIKKNIQLIISCMPSDAIYIYMSSIMAYGMPGGDKHLKEFKIPRALYGFIKRKAEKAARLTGAKYKIKTYNFRLGQVHGFLQSVSESFRDKLSAAKVAYLDGNETDLTNTIFISSLSEAIISCGLNEHKPSTYTLISYPQWTLSELYNFYIDYFSLNIILEYRPEIRKKSSIKTKVINRVMKYRPLIEIYILTKFPKASIALKGKYRTGEMANVANAGKVFYLDYNLLGTPGLPVIENINSSIDDIFQKEKLMENLYVTLLEKNITNA